MSNGFQIVQTLDPQQLVITISGGLVPRGAYDSGHQYIVGDAPEYQGNSYICYTQPPVGTAPSNTSYWQKIYTA